MSRFMRRFNKEEGFTLIELLIVIAILGILVALAVPRMSGVTETAKNAADEANRRTLMSAASMWYAQNPMWYAQNSKDEIKWTRDKKDGEDGWGAYLQEWPDNPRGTGDYTVTIKKDGTITISPSTETTTPSGG